jgi:virginiamycin B lyase
MWGTLTSIEQAGWTAAAEQSPYRNKLGDTRYLPRFQFFCKVNMLRAAAGVAYTTTAPTDFSLSPPFQAAILPTFAGEETTALAALWSGGQDLMCSLKIAAGPPTPAGVIPDTHQLRNIANFPATTSPAQDLTTAWAEQYGSLPVTTPYNIRFRFEPSNADNGITGKVTDYVLSVSGPPSDNIPTPGTACSSAPTIETGIEYGYDGATSSQAWLQLDVAAATDYTIVFNTDDDTNTPNLQAGPDCSTLVTLHTFAQTDAYTFAAQAGTDYYLAAQPFAAGKNWTVYFAPTLQPQLDQLWFGLTNGDPTIDQVNELGQFTELNVSESSTDPTWVCFDRTGSVWATLTASSQLSVTTPAGQTTTYDTTSPDAEPLIIILGTDNNLWFTLPGTSQIGRATPTGTLTSWTTPTNPSSPYWIVNGPDNNLWFTDIQNGTIDRITTSGAITEFACPPGSEPTNMCVGPDGNIWACDQGNNTILRCTMAGQITAFAIPTPGSEPNFIAPGPNCTLWFTEANGNNIGAITMAGTITEYPIPTASSLPYQIIYGPDNAMWFAEFLGNNIGKIDAAGKITEWPIAAADSFPAFITAGNENDLWVPHFGTPSITHLTRQRVIEEYNTPSGLTPATNMIITPKSRDYGETCCCMPPMSCCSTTCPTGVPTMPTYITQDGSGSAPNSIYFGTFVTTTATYTPLTTDLITVVRGGVTGNTPISALLPLIGGGGPQTVTCLFWKNVAADIAPTALFTPTKTGQYLVSIYTVCTVASSPTAAYPQVILAYTDDSGPQSYEIFAVPTNIVGSINAGPAVVQCVGGQPVTFSIIDGNPYNGGQYSIMATVTLLGNCSPTTPPGPPPSTLPIVATTPGSYSGVVPSGITVLTVTLTAGGQGGGASTTGFGGTGGGGGGMFTGTLAVTPGQMFTYTVPAAGTSATFALGSNTAFATAGPPAPGPSFGGYGGSAGFGGTWLTTGILGGGSTQPAPSTGNTGGGGGGGAAGDTGSGATGLAPTLTVGGAGGAGGSGSIQPGGDGGQGATDGVSAAADGDAPGGGGGGDSTDNQGAGAGATGQVTISGT